jgi:(p)ppGpp synthase/HD superfamily hydrolase
MTSDDIDLIAIRLAERLSQQPRWLSTAAASKYASINETKLKALAKEGRISGSPDPDMKNGKWIFDRLSIDAYREAQLLKKDEKSIDEAIQRFINKL